MPRWRSVRRTGRWEPSTRRMVSSFSAAGYLIRGRPQPRSDFFDQPQLERLLGHDLLERARLLAQRLHFVRGRGTRRVARQAALAGFEELFGPSVVQALGDALAPAQGGDALLPAQALQHDADLVLGRMLLARAAPDVADHPLGGRLGRGGRPPAGRGGDFLPHLRSSAVTMSRNSSLPQRAPSVSRALTADT